MQVTDGQLISKDSFIKMTVKSNKDTVYTITRKPGGGKYEV